ncbi:MAG: hypothetical protein M5U28_07860 [Sandaracinaceae bacterium]|nr:hypothetical protein [Sandaracinaceae bacterium]
MASARRASSALSARTSIFSRTPRGEGRAARELGRREPRAERGRGGEPHALEALPIDGRHQAAEEAVVAQRARAVRDEQDRRGAARGRRGRAAHGLSAVDAAPPPRSVEAPELERADLLVARLGRREAHAIDPRRAVGRVAEDPELHAAVAVEAGAVGAGGDGALREDAAHDDGERRGGEHALDAQPRSRELDLEALIIELAHRHAPALGGEGGEQPRGLGRAREARDRAHHVAREDGAAAVVEDARAQADRRDGPLHHRHSVGEDRDDEAAGAHLVEAVEDRAGERRLEVGARARDRARRRAPARAG